MSTTDFAREVESRMRDVEQRLRNRSFVDPEDPGPSPEDMRLPGLPPRTSRSFSAAEFDGRPVPPREWLVPERVPMNTVTILGGDGGTGKSLLALQLAAGVAAGGEWLGLPVKQGSVIYLSAEDDEDELHRHLHEIRHAMKLGYRAMAGLTLRSLAGEDALLAVETGLALSASTLLQELEACAAAEPPALMVIDTLADVFPSNENDRAKVRQFIGLLRGLALRRRCALVLLAHPSLTGLSTRSGTSGSTAWNNSVRSRLYLERVVQHGYEADPNRRTLRTMKANYGPVGDQLSLTWTAGVFVAGTTPVGLDRLAAGVHAEGVFLALLDEFTRQGRHVNASSGANYAPAQFASSSKADGITKRAFKAAL